MKLKLSYDTRKQILGKVQYCGLTGLGWILRGLTLVLFGAETWRGFSTLSTTEWIRESSKYSLPKSTIAGIDKALRENLRPEEALDRLARKAGVSKREIDASFIGPWVEPPKDLPTDEEILAKRIALETSIAASIKKS